MIVAIFKLIGILFIFAMIILWIYSLVEWDGKCHYDCEYCPYEDDNCPWKERKEDG